MQGSSDNGTGGLLHSSAGEYSSPAQSEPPVFNAEVQLASGAEEAGASFLDRYIPGPKWVRKILLSELCERFSFYALRAVLVLYFKGRLGWSSSASISIYFFSAALSYFTPLLGAYVADAKIGKFKTILVFSAIYIAGSFFLSLSAFVSPEPGSITEITSNGSQTPSASSLDGCIDTADSDSSRGGVLKLQERSGGAAAIAIVALILIAIGTGGIKPNVSSFGADQFIGRPGAEKEIGSYFAVFYFCINVGSVVSFIISPLLRVFAGFGVTFALPTILLSIATLIVYSGKRQYIVNKPGRSPLETLATVIKTSLRERKRRRRNNEEIDDVDSSTMIKRHWIEAARGNDGCSEQDVKDTIAVWRMISILATLPLFWTLFDQQGSAWTLQADSMYLHGIQPDQLGVLNPILVLCLIPIFEKFLYPWYNKSKLGNRYPNTPIRRMGLGMVVAALAFVMSALVQSIIDANEAKTVSVFFMLPQIATITVSEILVSITGLEFVYSQAPLSMKSSCMSIFLVTTAIGDVFGGLLYSILGCSLGASSLFLLCAVLMLCNTVFFRWAAKRFVPINASSLENETNHDYRAPDSNI